MGRHEEALLAISEAKTVANQSGNPLLAAQVQIAGIDSLGMLGKYDEATILGNALAVELTAVGAVVDAAKVQGNLGSIALRQDRYTDALTAYAAAEALVPVDSEPLLQAGLAINRAIAQSYLGHDRDALAGYEKALSVYMERDLSFEAAVARSNIGFLHHAMGRHALALAALTAAYPVFFAAGRDQEAARCDLDTADTYRALNLFAEARLCYERALSVYQRLPLVEDIGRVHLGLAAVVAQEHKDADARTQLDTAEQHFIETGNLVQQAHVRLCRADLALRSGDTATALREAFAASLIFQNAGLDGWENEASLLMTLSTPAPDIQDLLNIAEVARRTARGWLECRAEQAAGNLFHRLGNPVLARTHLQKAVDALESVRTQVAPEDLHLAFIKDKESVYADLVALILENNPTEADINDAVQIVERSRSRLLLEKLLSAQPENKVESALVQGRLLEIRANLNRAYRDGLGFESDESRRPGNFRISQLPRLEAEYQRTLLEAERQRDIPNALNPLSLPSPAELQAGLADGETILLFTQVANRLAVFLVNQNNILIRRDLPLVREIAHVSRRLRYHLQKRHSALEVRSIIAPEATHEIDDVFRTLYDLLIRPIEQDLHGRRLIIVPQGPVHGLPFQAFRDGGDYLQDRFEIQYAPSASVWHILSNKPSSLVPPTAPALLVGVAGIGTQQVAAEITAIATHIPSKVILNEEATLENLRRDAATAPLLHLATHALFRRDNPLFSGLQLADDWLLARDLYQWTLTANLVTLSACDTGAVRIEAGEEWMGLARGFLAAGARRLLVSLWSADDKVTAELMGRFYRLLEQQVSPVSALRQAQQTIREDWPHPYYWAPFCLVGPG
jgi:CHAT domain-containing protein